MLVLFDLLMVVAVIWAALQVWSYWVRHDPLPAGVPAEDEWQFRFRQLSRTSLDRLRGRHGRKKKWLTIAILVAFVMACVLLKSFVLALVAFMLMVIWLQLRERRAMSNYSVPVPPSPPPSANVPPPLVSPPLVEKRLPRRVLLWCWIIIAGVCIWKLSEGGTLLHGLRDYVPQAALFWDDDEGHDRPSRSFVGELDRAKSAGHHPHDRNQTGVAIEHKVPDAMRIAKDHADAVKQAANEMNLAAQAIVPVRGEEDKPSEEASTKDLPSASAMSALGANEKEASRALFRLMGERLVAEAIRAGRPVEMANWVPSSEWTRQNFAKDIRLEKVPSRTSGVTLLEARADFPSLDEKRIEQVYHEFINDQVAGRSLALMKIFAGSVLVLGGASVFLRLGTGRQLVPAGVWSKGGWWRNWKR
ncbi:hypothetical protein K2X85_10520 [bacterium]|nr:hypothetical protein [bacterium]